MRKKIRFNQIDWARDSIGLVWFGKVLGSEREDASSAGISLKFKMRFCKNQLGFKRWEAGDWDRLEVFTDLDFKKEIQLGVKGNRFKK